MVVLLLSRNHVGIVLLERPAAGEISKANASKQIAHTKNIQISFVSGHHIAYSNT